MTGAAPRPQVRETSREEAILAAALELFSQRTFDGTPVPLVAKRAGVSPGTLYRYFPSKEALVNELYRRCKDELAQALGEEATEGLPPREAFGRLWRRLGRFAAERGSAFRFLEMHHHASYLDARSRAVADAVGGAVAGFVERAQAAGALRSGRPEVQIAMAFGAFVGLVKGADEGRFELDEEVLTVSEEAAWRLLRA